MQASHPSAYQTNKTMYDVTHNDFRWIYFANASCNKKRWTNEKSSKNVEKNSANNKKRTTVLRLLRKRTPSYIILRNKISSIRQQLQPASQLGVASEQFSLMSLKHRTQRFTADTEAIRQFAITSHGSMNTPLHHSVLAGHHRTMCCFVHHTELCVRINGVNLLMRTLKTICWPQRFRKSALYFNPLTPTVAIWVQL